MHEYHNKLDISSEVHFKNAWCITIITNLLFIDSSLKTLSHNQKTKEFNLYSILLPEVPIAQKSWFIMFLTISSVLIGIVQVISSKQIMELSLAASFNGFGVVAGAANSLDLFLYHIIFFNKEYKTDFQLPVQPVNNKAG
ncbi:MAG: hypothetical protein NZZ41_07550 [Candidatus Dojkabacteria bacterium]|nr:hypothetical protein [Candidatus Dojkabacteria bacterium]